MRTSRWWLLCLVVVACDEQPAPESLEVSADEAPGLHCGLGGTRTESGRDLDRDGLLSPDEVTTTVYTCVVVLDGDYLIENTLDAEMLAGVTTITGTLTVLAAGMPTLALPDLEEVGGTLDVAGSGDLASISIPALRHVGADLWIREAWALTMLDLGALTTIDGGLLVVGTPLTDLEGLAALSSAADLSLGDNPELTSLAGLQSLASVTGELSVAGSPLIADLVGLDGLSSVGRLLLGQLALRSLDGLVITSATEVRLLDLPELDDASALGPLLAGVQLLQITRLSALHDFSFLAGTGPNTELQLVETPNLEDLDALAGLTSIGYLNVTANPALTTISLALLESAKGFSISGNDQLAELTMPFLTGAGSEIRIWNNAVLPRCDVDDLLAELEDAGWSGTVYAHGSVNCP